MNNDQKIKLIRKFTKKNKFEKDKLIFYPGLSVVEQKLNINELINLIAVDFETILQEGSKKERFQQAIKIGLDKITLSGFNVDSEDADRVCLYIEELMDIVELEESGGHLNIWRYGFDPNSF